MLVKILKGTGMVLGSLVLLLGIAYAVIARNITERVEKTYDFARESFPIPNDSLSIERGKHVALIKGCIECHGENLAGKVMIDEPPMGRLVATNLTRGKGGLPDDYAAEDWIRALRHGVGRNGRPLIFMPSHETTLLSQEDMAALIAYCRQLPPVDQAWAPIKLGPVVQVFSYLDKMPLLSVEKIDHHRALLTQADTSGGIAQGKYLAVSCSGCHQPDFKGGEGAAPGSPPVPNLTRSGHVGQWTQQQFIHTLRTGHTPEGRVLKNEDMPWKMTAQYQEKELVALYKYFRSLP
ncbi:hypothetical protein BWI97_18655 [Siphonobacter sp. BAB-5405]|uniref:c-type cytochrome n=1 Tax=Siphonobacter sp. BAB-5405 TaxID=1864825 RepID=UPI000C7F7D56|nr:c-type cytochrome [Siphonobacter sp. BAB-5405]PMD93238.1 hypothetical protein BWI97_18655 [Siphonobacter sp. BAB-5405]